MPEYVIILDGDNEASWFYKKDTSETLWKTSSYSVVSSADKLARRNTENLEGYIIEMKSGHRDYLYEDEESTATPHAGYVYEITQPLHF